MCDANKEMCLSCLLLVLKTMRLVHDFAFGFTPFFLVCWRECAGRSYRKIFNEVVR